MRGLGSAWEGGICSDWGVGGVQQMADRKSSTLKPRSSTFCVDQAIVLMGRRYGINTNHT